MGMRRREGFAPSPPEYRGRGEQLYVPQPEPNMRFASLLESLARWLRSDRIRIAPSDGAILRLTPDAVIVVRDVAFRVTARRVVSLAGGPAVVYDCESERSRCQLRIEPASPRARIVFIDADEETPLAEDDVEIFPSRGVCR